MIKTSAPGKVILFGEHAVVYDKLGIATSIDKRAYVTVSNGKEGITIESKNLGLKKLLSEKKLFTLLKDIENLKTKKDFERIKEISKDKLLASFFVVAKLTEKFGFRGLKILIDSEIPKNLGSSSSIFSAIVLGVSIFLGKKISKKDIAKIANEGDIVAHGGLSSGIDANTVTYGGYLKYKKSEGIIPLDINFEIPLVIVDSGEPARTGETVPYINKLKEENPGLIEEVLDRLDEISRFGLDAIKAQNLKKIGRLMINYYQELKKLNISTASLDKIVQIALDHQVLGVKPTGGWGGGCCIVLTKNQKEIFNLIKEFKINGFKSFQSKIGVEGVKLVI